MITRNLRNYQAIFILITVAFCGSSALHILNAIEIKSLWADELKTFYKTVSLSTPQMMNYLRSDSHPPLYYLALQSWFSFFEPNTTTLRLASWINYVIGGILMTIQTFKLGKNETKSRAWVAACIGALITFSSPIALRFSIEGKGYSLLVMLIAAGLICRQNYITSNKDCQYSRLNLAGSFIFLACASLTHYYGLFLTTSVGIVDFTKAFALKNYNQKQRIAVSISEALACLPCGLWALGNLTHLTSTQGISWIGKPDFGLLESILADYIGPFPIPKIIIMGIILLTLYRMGLMHYQNTKLISISKYSTLDLGGAPAGALMSFAVIAISFIYPFAYSRYFVILLPIIAPLTAVYISKIEPKNTTTLLALIGYLVLIWSVVQHDAFDNFKSQGSIVSTNKSSNYRAMSTLTVNEQNRFTLNPLIDATTSDLVANSDNLIESMPIEPWRSLLERDLTSPNSLPNTMVIAATGNSNRKRLKDAIRKLQENQFKCTHRITKYKYTDIYSCARQSNELKKTSN